MRMPKLYYLQKLLHSEGIVTTSVSGKEYGFGAPLGIDERVCPIAITETCDDYPAKGTE